MPASSLRGSHRLTWQSSRIDKVIPSSRSLPRLWRPGTNINGMHTDDFSCVDTAVLDCFTPAAFAKTGSIYRHNEEAAPTSCACVIFLCLRLPRNDAQRRILLLQCSRKDNRFIVIARSNATWRTRMAVITTELDCFGSFTTSQ